MKVRGTAKNQDVFRRPRAGGQSTDDRAKAGRQSGWEVTTVTVVTGGSGTVKETVMKERCKIQVYIATDGLIRTGND